ncbi:F-box domain-containing protein [Favolaschia claudopus]|uniref:F-box domain-containing protein n=1 Tax=Favolaschia claudopus TaxID=2862362 RepID=A0AAW0A7R2_9AGAR
MLPAHDPYSDPYSSNSALRERLCDIDAEIEELHARLARVGAERKIIADALGSIVYPILTLPVEITAEIFAQHLDGLFGEWLQSPVVDLQNARSAGPLFLSQVCRAWRSIAINMSSLWCGVRASYSGRIAPDWRNLLEYWLARAGNQSLYLDLARDPIQTALLHSTVAPYSSQLRALECCLPTPTSYPVDTIGGRLPLLRRLKIWWTPETEIDESEMTPIATFSEAPELRKVEISYLPLRWISLPFAQLTHLTLFGQNIAESIEALHQSPNLEDISLDLQGPLGETQLIPVTLNHVRELRLPNDFEWTRSYLPYLTLHGLRSLEIMSEYSREDDVEVFRAFLQRSQCTLDSLSLHCDFRVAMSALEATGNVSKLTIYNIDWNTWNLEQFLVQITSDPTFLPNLRSLHLLYCETIIPYAKVVDLLSARWKNPEGVARLESFRFIRERGDTDDEPSAALQARLSSLADEGLDIRIQSLNHWKVLDNLGALDRARRPIKRLCSKA